MTAGSYDGVKVIASGATASFDGTGSNFFFSNGTSYFYIIPWSQAVVSDAAQVQISPGQYVDYYNGNYSPANWHVTAVPEPESFALMLAGLGLIGGLARRRKVRPA